MQKQYETIPSRKLLFTLLSLFLIIKQTEPLKVATVTYNVAGAWSDMWKKGGEAHHEEALMFTPLFKENDIVFVFLQGMYTLKHPDSETTYFKDFCKDDEEEKWGLSMIELFAQYFIPWGDGLYDDWRVDYKAEGAFVTYIYYNSRAIKDINKSITTGFLSSLLFFKSKGISDVDSRVAISDPLNLDTYVDFKELSEPLTKEQELLKKTRKAAKIKGLKGAFITTVKIGQTDFVLINTELERLKPKSQKKKYEKIKNRLTIIRNLLLYGADLPEALHQNRERIHHQSNVVMLWAGSFNSRLEPSKLMELESQAKMAVGEDHPFSTNFLDLVNRSFSLDPLYKEIANNVRLFETEQTLNNSLEDYYRMMYWQETGPPAMSFPFTSSRTEEIDPYLTTNVQHASFADRVLYYTSSAGGFTRISNQVAWEVPFSPHRPVIAKFHMEPEMLEEIEPFVMFEEISEIDLDMGVTGVGRSRRHDVVTHEHDLGGHVTVGTFPLPDNIGVRLYNRDLAKVTKAKYKYVKEQERIKSGKELKKGKTPYSKPEINFEHTPMYLKVFYPTLYRQLKQVKKSTMKSLI